MGTVNAPSKDARRHLGCPCALASAVRPWPFFRLVARRPPKFQPRPPRVLRPRRPSLLRARLDASAPLRPRPP
eukprot:7673666-Pyramimonas_sp.AAC.1